MAGPTLTFGQWIRKTRSNKKMSAAECAERANMKPPVWSNWENDRSRRKDGKPAIPEPETMERIAYALDEPLTKVMEAARYFTTSVPDEFSIELAKELSLMASDLDENKKKVFREAVKQSARQAKQLLTLTAA